MGKQGAVIGLAAEFDRAVFRGHETLPRMLAGDRLICCAHQIFNVCFRKNANAVIGKKTAPRDAFPDAGMRQGCQNMTTPIS